MTIKEYYNLFISQKTEENRKAYYKACYEIYVKSKGNSNLLEIAAIEEDVSTKLIKDHAFDYAKIYLGINNDGFAKEMILADYDNNISKKNQTIFSNELFQKLLLEDDESKIIELIEYSKIETNYISEKIRDFVYSYFSPSEHVKIIQLLNSKISIYINYKNTELNKEENTNEINSKNEKKISTIASKIKEMVYLIENGIQCENGSIRPFDIVDYYQIVKVDFNNLIHFCQTETDGLNSHDLRTVKTFINQNKSNVNSSIIARKQFISNTPEYNCQKDERGNLIVGSGRKLTLEEKEQIIELFELENIPENKLIYSIASRRYVNGTLTLTKKRTNSSIK